MSVVKRIVPVFALAAISALATLAAPVEAIETTDKAQQILIAYDDHHGWNPNLHRSSRSVRRWPKNRNRNWRRDSWHRHVHHHDHHHDHHR